MGISNIQSAHFYSPNPTEKAFLPNRDLLIPHNSTHSTTVMEGHRELSSRRPSEESKCMKIYELLPPPMIKHCSRIPKLTHP